MGDAISSDNDYIKWARAAQALRGGGTFSGPLSVGAVGGVAVAVEPEPFFEQIGRTLRGVEDLVVRVEGLTDKLLGSDALCGAAGSIPPRPSGLVYGLIDDAGRTDRRIRDAMAALARLEAKMGA